MAGDEPHQISQNEIEDLLRQARTTKPGEKPAAASPAGAGKPTAEEASLSQNDIESLLASKGGPAPGPSSGSPPQASAPPPPPAAAAPSSPPPAPAQTAPAAPPPRPAPAPAAPARAPTTAASGMAAAPAAESPIAPADIELLLNHAERALASVEAPATGALPTGVGTFKFEDFGGAPPSTEAATIELIRDVELDLKIELGRTHMYLEDVLKLKRGSVVPLDKLAGDPVDIYVNGRLIARGEVLVLNDNFCVRVAELVSAETAAAG